jgi:hypothetical protein
MVVTKDCLFILVPSNPDTIRDIPKYLSPSPVISGYSSVASIVDQAENRELPSDGDDSQLY